MVPSAPDAVITLAADPAPPAAVDPPAAAGVDFLLAQALTSSNAVAVPATTLAARGREVIRMSSPCDGSGCAVDHHYGPSADAVQIRDDTATHQLRRLRSDAIASRA
jgi:hypothetical protein